MSLNQDGTNYNFMSEDAVSDQQKPIQQASTTSVVQYPHPNSFRDRPYRDLFEGSNQQLSSSPNNCPPAHYTADNELATALERMGRNNKGKSRANPKASPNHDSTAYQPNHLPPYEENIWGIQRQQQASIGPLGQYPPSNRPRDGPSGSFFERSKGVEIKGGNFNHIYGHHTGVTILVNQPREGGTSLQDPLPPLSLPPSQKIKENMASQPTQNIRGSQFPSVIGQPSTSVYNVASSPAQDIHSGQLPSMATCEQGPSATSTIYAPANGNNIYMRHLGLAQRGSPLWIPEPDRNLPMPYRRKGVDIGDVGIITPTGGFSFMFNICLPHDNPINPRTLPDGFTPIYPPIEPMDVRVYSEFKPESYLASTAIEKIHNDPPFPGLSFATSAAEGAVLTFPDGAISHNLTSIRRFRAYAATNIESWYRYVNGTRGWETENGEIHLVIGCDKATSWGMAAIANMTEQKTHYLKYRSIGDGGATPAPIPLYKWEYTGMVQARVGPDLAEIANLKQNDDSNVEIEGKYWNQCLFIRTLIPMLSADVFAAIIRESESALIQKSQRFQNKAGSSSSASNPSDNGSRQGSTREQEGTDSQTMPPSEYLGWAAKIFARERITALKSTSAPKSHPTDVLNKRLLQKFRNCRVVITQDEDWCSIINKDDEIMPSPSEIAERVLATHDIKEEDGVVFLAPKKDLQRINLSHDHPAPNDAQGEQITRAQVEALAGKPVVEVQRQRDVSVKLLTSSFQGLAKAQDNVGLLTQLLNPDVEKHPPNYPYMRGFNREELRRLEMSTVVPVPPMTAAAAAALNSNQLLVSHTSDVTDYADSHATSAFDDHDTPQRVLSQPRDQYNRNQSQGGPILRLTQITPLAVAPSKVGGPYNLLETVPISGSASSEVQRLNNFCQATNMPTPVYETSTYGPQSQAVHEAKVFINEVEYGLGSAISKKMAKEVAASVALGRLLVQDPDYDL